MAQSRALVVSDHAVILLVEDQEDDIFLIRKAFKRAEVPNPIHVVRDGEEAIEYLSGEGRFSNRDEHPLPEIILLDLKMPRRDGFQVLQWIRSQPGLSEIAVIVLTSSEQVWEINTAYSIGANSFLVKPGDFEDYKSLASVLQSFWLKFARRAESARPPRKKKSENGHKR
jgi:CheY-like chemotaxis protein